MVMIAASALPTGGLATLIAKKVDAFGRLKAQPATPIQTEKEN